MQATAIEQSTVSAPATARAQFVTIAGLLALAAVAAGCLFLLPGEERPAAYISGGRILLACTVYLALAKVCLYIGLRPLRSALFALVNIGAIGLFFDMTQGKSRLLFLVGGYLVMVSWHYAMLRLYAQRGGAWPWLAFSSPILMLAMVRYTPFVFNPIQAAVPGIMGPSVALFFIGISFMAFRLSHLVLEVRNGLAPRPDYWEYLGFAFFLPTLVVGPINPYHTHQRSLTAPDRAVTPVGRSWLRILVGAAKYQFLGNIFNQLSYSALLLDGHPHPPVDLFVAVICYHLYLYCNFSGFCDIAIGAAGLMGIQVKENFQAPLTARSVQEYWTRWHITLSTYMRDVVFSPVSKALVNRLGPRHVNHAIAIGILVVFLLIGIWHGVGWNYAVHGALQAVAVATNHYYTVWLKKKLGKKGYQAYLDNRWISAVAVTVTFLYISASLFFFANNFDTMRKIFGVIQG